jgi:alcohol dehydrogenase (cytochrome c)
MAAFRLALASTVMLCAIFDWQESPSLAQSPGGRGGTTDWPLHNLDISNSRYSTLDEINVSNAGRLQLKWSFDAPQGANFGAMTPLVVDGVMYFNSGSRLFALDAATGKSLWMFELPQSFTGGGRGPAYGDGRIYAFGASLMYAVDAKTGKPIESFGQKGVLRIVNEALAFKYPGKYPPDLNPTTLGYSMSNPPTYWNGALYVGLPFSDSLLPGGLVAAVDGRTGAIKWVFNTIPQGPQDDGWDLTKDTWSEAGRYGGGIWTTPAIDPQLGMIYFNAGNPSPNYDASSRIGINLFTNSIVALNLATGKRMWHFQTVHHDIWDRDLVSGPVLFDVQVQGRTVKGIGALGKNCHATFLNRETGQPINPIVETTMPTTTDVPGEQVWPTQPVAYTANGQPQLPFCATYPIVSDPELAKRVRPSQYPYQVNELVITAPGNTGGANYGGPSFSTRTGLLYATGKNDAWSIKVKPVGATLKPGAGNMGHFAVIGEQGKTGVTVTTSVAAYDPATGRQAWIVELPGTTNGGSLVTAGDVLFQPIGNGDFYALDARSGQSLFKFTAPRGIRATPLTYQIAGRQYVSLVATNSVLTFALP